MVDDGGQGQAVVGLVDHLPQPLAGFPAEALLALHEEAALSVVALPAVDVARLVVAAQHEDLRGVQTLEREQVRRGLQARQAAVHVVAQEQELAGRKAHAQVPHIVAEEVQILQVAVDVSKHVHGRLQEQTAQLVLKDGRHARGQRHHVLSEALRLHVVDAVLRTAEHLDHAVGQEVHGLRRELADGRAGVVRQPPGHAVLPRARRHRPRLVDVPGRAAERVAPLHDLDGRGRRVQLLAAALELVLQQLDELVLLLQLIAQLARLIFQRLDGPLRLHAAVGLVAGLQDVSRASQGGRGGGIGRLSNAAREPLRENRQHAQHLRPTPVRDFLASRDDHGRRFMGRTQLDHLLDRFPEASWPQRRRRRPAQRAAWHKTWHKSARWGSGTTLGSKHREDCAMSRRRAADRARWTLPKRLGRVRAR
eukprot:scaffold3356_cov264-Pinguiococcus_pyrenoidosus.AAC.17